MLLNSYFLVFLFSRMFPGKVGRPWCAVSRPAPGPPSSGCTLGSTAAKRHCILPPVYLHSGRVSQRNILKVQFEWIILHTSHTRSTATNKSSYHTTNLTWVCIKYSDQDHFGMFLMAYFHWRIRIQIRTQTWDSKPYGYIVLCRTCFHWLGFRFGSLTHSICIEQESESESKSESESGNGHKP